MKAITILLAFTLNFGLFSVQSQDLGLWHGDTLNAANTAGHLTYLTTEEKKVIQLINLARMDGAAFLKRIAIPYIQKNSFDDDEFVESLHNDLKKTLGLHPLKPAEKLWESAAHHAYDMGHKGLIGHESSDGTPHHIRIKRYHQADHVAESLCYGYNEALDIVMQLLLDEAIETRTNRYNILNSNLHHIGLSIKPHREYDHNAVIDFSNR